MRPPKKPQGPRFYPALRKHFEDAAKRVASAQGKRHAQTIYQQLADSWERQRITVDTRGKIDGQLICWLDCLGWILRQPNRLPLRIVLLAVPRSFRVLHAVVVDHDRIVYDPASTGGYFDPNSFAYTFGPDAKHFAGQAMEAWAVVGFTDVESSPTFSPLY